jgi:leucyl/phenylalanyl-tRNA--protein transferase
MDCSPLAVISTRIGSLQPTNPESFPGMAPENLFYGGALPPEPSLTPLTFKPARSLRKFQRKVNYVISINQCTDKIIKLCAITRAPEETWLDESMQAAYLELARLGYCHSVEVWLDHELVGGLYGIQVGQIFCGESMFSLKTNASKVALWGFCRHFTRHGGQLIDCQVMNPHLASLGAEELNRDNFMQSLLRLKNRDVDSQCYQSQWLSPDDVSC